MCYRLILERSDSAKMGVEIVTSLIDQYGQGGRFETDSSEHYCGAFLIADKTEAWVVECAGKFWIAKQIKGNYMILKVINNDCRQRKDKHIQYLKIYMLHQWFNTFSDYNMVEQLKIHEILRGCSQR